MPRRRRGAVYADAHGCRPRRRAYPQYARTSERSRLRRRPAENRGSKRRSGACRRRVRARVRGVRARVHEAIRRARDFGVRSRCDQQSSFGVAVYHLEAVGAAGLVEWHSGTLPPHARGGGTRPIFGTNPIAGSFRARTRRIADRSIAVRGGARQADDRGERGQVDPARLGAGQGRQPTTDPKAGLEGSMLRSAEPKARCSRSSSSCWPPRSPAPRSIRATSFFVDEGNRPRLGQAFLVIDLRRSRPAIYDERIET